MESKYAPQVATLLASILWGSSFVAIGWGLKYLDPYSFAFLRFVFAALIMFGFAASLSKFDFRLFRDRRIILIGAINGAAYLLQFVGQKYITPQNSAIAALLVNTNVIVVALLSAKLFGEKLEARKKYAVAIGLAGVLFITTKGNMNVLSGSGAAEFFGGMLVLLAGIIWAFYIVFSKSVLSDRRRSIMQITACVFAYTALVMLLPSSYPAASKQSRKSRQADGLS